MRRIHAPIFREISDDATHKSVKRKAEKSVASDRRAEAHSDGFIRGLQLLKYGIS